jgi:putative holliday junction resolvase
MRILAIDPGLKKIGTAMCDSTGVVARAMEILPHLSVEEDVTRILAVADREHAEIILVGCAHLPGTPASSIARYTHRLLAGLRSASSRPVTLVDESFSSRTAQQARIERGDRKKARYAADDSLAAAAILQEYLDAHHEQ